MFENTYKNKKVLITGHTGFKGSWLAIWLKELGAEVIGYALDPPSNPNNFEATKLKEKITHIHGDVRNLDHLLEAFSKYQPEFVFHLAAQPIVRLSYDEPKLTFDTNVGGTVNVFEGVRKTPSVKVLVNITSDKCYKNKEWVWGYRENDPMGGHDPYSASKGCSELVFNAYLRCFFSSSATTGRTIGAASARAGNVIGGGDWGKDRLVPDCIRALSSGQTISIRSPRAVRPWQHVLEPLSGYLLLGAALWRDSQQKGEQISNLSPAQANLSPKGTRNYSGAWNFGPDDRSHLTVAAMTDRLIKYWGSGAWDDLSDPKGLHEANLLKLNCDKAHAELNWRSSLSINECLQMTADWYRIYYSKNQNVDVYALCVEQLRSYMDKAATMHLSWAK